MSASRPNASAVGLGRAATMFVAPRAVFRHVAETGRYGWVLAAMILLTTLIGWATVQTGLIDRQVGLQTLQALEKLEREQIDLLSRAELSEALDNIREQAEFTTLIARGGAVLAPPVGLVAGLMLIAAGLFAVVALTGNKPDYHTLMAVCVYAAVVDVLAAGLRLALMLSYRTLDVDTSLGLLVQRTPEPTAAQTILSAIDPFRAWFWILVGLGLVVTGQLSRRAATITCLLCWLIACGVRMIPIPAG